MVVLHGDYASDVCLNSNLSGERSFIYAMIRVPNQPPLIKHSSVVTVVLLSHAITTKEPARVVLLLQGCLTMRSIVHSCSWNVAMVGTNKPA